MAHRQVSIYTCDACGEEADHETYVSSWNSLELSSKKQGHGPAGRYPAKQLIRLSDVCPQCSQALVDFWGGLSSKDQSP